MSITSTGDCFIGALAVGIVQGHNLVRTLEFALNAAALSVTRKGAMASIPSVEDVLRFDS